MIRPVGRDSELSFVNLVEAITLAGFRETGVSMQKVRRALEYAQRHYAQRDMDMEHLLAHKKVLTDGIDLFWKYQERHHDDTHLVNISRAGQKVFPETVMRYLRELDWAGDSIASRWWPGRQDGRGYVVVDPRRAFGAPVIAGTGVKTEDLFDRFQAGESIEELADDYGLTRAQIEAAVRVETQFEPYAAA